MKRDMDLITRILEEIESMPAGASPKLERRGYASYDIQIAKSLGVDSLEPANQEQLERWEHICLAEEAGLLRIGQTHGYADDPEAFREIRALTTRGHDVLAALKSTSVRKIIQEKMKDGSVVRWTFEALLAVFAGGVTRI